MRKGKPTAVPLKRKAHGHAMPSSGFVAKADAFVFHAVAGVALAMILAMIIMVAAIAARGGQ